MNIRVNTIAPGATRTKALERVLTVDIEVAMLRHTPLKRLGDPDDMATAALFPVDFPGPFADSLTAPLSSL